MMYMENVLDALALYGYLNLEDRIEFELDGVIEKEIAPAYCNENFELCISCMDYTSLKVTDTEKSIVTFVFELLKRTPCRMWHPYVCFPASLLS